MESLLPYLNQYQPRAQYAQIASGGNWEQAVRIELTSSQNFDISGIGPIDKSVAAEIFYRLNDDRMLFFGIRFSDSLNAVSSPSDFLDKVLHTLQSASKNSLYEMLANLGSQLDNDEHTFVDAQIEYVELGVIDSWKSVGSKVLRKIGGPELTIDEVRSTLATNPNLVKNDKNHTALEFAVGSLKCWFGVQVSQEESGTYNTNLQTVVALANTI